MKKVHFRLIISSDDCSEWSFFSCRDSDGTNSETDRDTLGPLPAPQTTIWAPPAPPPAYLTQQQQQQPLGYATPMGGLGPIYNPAPPPSTYMTFNYGGVGGDTGLGVHSSAGFGGYGQKAQHSPSSGSSGSGTGGGSASSFIYWNMFCDVLIRLPNKG
jgi:hypothetical protein